MLAGGGGSFSLAAGAGIQLLVYFLLCSLFLQVALTGTERAAGSATIVVAIGAGSPEEAIRHNTVHKRTAPIVTVLAGDGGKGATAVRKNCLLIDDPASIDGAVLFQHRLTPAQPLRQD